MPRALRVDALHSALRAFGACGASRSKSAGDERRRALCVLR